MQSFPVLRHLAPGALQLCAAKIQERSDAALGHPCRCALREGKAFSVLLLIGVQPYQATPSEIKSLYSF